MMKTEAKTIETWLRENLTGEEAELFDRLGRPSYADLVTDVFRGSLRWLNLFGLLLSLAFFGLTLYFLAGLLQASEAVSVVRWSVGFLASLMMVSLIKMWFWMEVHRSAQRRELKRLEVQVAWLAARVEPRDGAEGQARA